MILVINEYKYLIKINISENEQFGSLANFQFTISPMLVCELTVMLVAEQLNVKVRCMPMKAYNLVLS